MYFKNVGLSNSLFEWKGRGLIEEWGNRVVESHIVTGEDSRPIGWELMTGKGGGYFP